MVDTQYTEAEERVLESYDALLHAIASLADASDVHEAAQDAAMNAADDADLTGSREGVERAIELLSVAAERGDFGDRTDTIREHVAATQQYSTFVIAALEQAVQDELVAASDGSPAV